ncbi:uncharacterized protein BDZ99DRAFT_526297 [Mytilinidion resinicola]|uniref:Uncharacterized protein n=1 Tax=Mytilinidion resinicola TaxID=574789 RepID=A0A6A6Y5M7_9PEZI|nr:uncharacterized protein BDZ99DRAFT_526297 [Mytilinidion resinicola]KAF2803828.1 hypothetical protein BDZ99DRAFT_526297 [Mytilinidion resinicola]
MPIQHGGIDPIDATINTRYALHTTHCRPLQPPARAAGFCSPAWPVCAPRLLRAWLRVGLEAVCNPSLQPHHSRSRCNSGHGHSHGAARSSAQAPALAAAVPHIAPASPQRPPSQALRASAIRSHDAGRRAFPGRPQRPPAPQLPGRPARPVHPARSFSGALHAHAMKGPAVVADDTFQRLYI